MKLLKWADKVSNFKNISLSTTRDLCYDLPYNALLDHGVLHYHEICGKSYIAMKYVDT